MFDFTGKVVVVTGGGSGIGAATAAMLSRSGAAVAVIDSDGIAADRVVATLTGPAISVVADVSSEADVDRYLDETVRSFGSVDLHHLNAGVSGTLASLPEVEMSDFDRVLAVNVRGSFLGLRAAFRQYQRQQTGGSVVLTASIAGLRGSRDLLPYQISKHALLGALHGGAVYGGPIGVRVNAVAPGLVPTGPAADPAVAEEMDRRGRTVPMRRTGTSAEVAQAVAYLLSDAASYVTGVALPVDGGAAVVSTVRSSGGAGAWDPSGLDVYGDWFPGRGPDGSGSAGAQ